MKISVIGIIDKELQQDFTGAIARVTEIGYQGMEMGLGPLKSLPFPPAEIKQRMTDQGLEMVNLHVGVGREALLAGFEDTCRLAPILGCTFLTVPWGPCDSADQIKRDAEFYSQLGARYRAEGLTLCYHNHDHEMKRFGGEHGLDILLKNSDPENLKSQLDIGWVHFGGVDPAAIIRKYPGRMPLVHLKDFARLEPGCETAHGDHEHIIFTEVGTGIVDFEAAFSAASEVGGIAWGSVEQDRMHNLIPFESITCSYLNLKARGLV
jgi:sugar phosphate isomerase/epimerase